MKYRDFEKKSGQKLKLAESYVDSEALIASLDKAGAFDPVKSQRSKWIVPFLMFLVLICAALIFWNVPETPNQITQLPSTSTNLAEVETSDIIKSFNNNPIHNVSHKDLVEDQKWSQIQRNQESPHKDSEIYASIDVIAMEEEQNILGGSPVEEKTNSDSGIANEWVDNTKEQVNRLPLDFSLSALPKLQFQSVETTAPTFEMVPFKDDCPGFGKPSPFRIELIPEVGAFIPFKQLINRSGEPNEVYSLRDQNEKTLEGLQAGLYGRISHRDIPFYLQTGVLYSRISEKMDLAYSSVRSDTTQGVISVTVSQMGDTITTIYGDIVTETLVNGRTTRHHYHRLLDVPLLLGYQYRNRYFDLGIEAGALFNVFMRSSGFILDSPEDFIDLRDQSPFKSRLGISYTVGMNVSREVGVGSLYLALRYRHTTDNYTVDHAEVQQSYRHVGLNIGYIIPIF